MAGTGPEAGFRAAEGKRGQTTTDAQEGQTSQSQGAGCYLPTEKPSLKRESLLPSSTLSLPGKAVAGPRTNEQLSPEPVVTHGDGCCYTD